MKTTTVTTTTCQLCGRAIKAASGTIAHHGYKRPGFGYQTNGCPGTHELPYEVSRNAITKHMTNVRNYINGQAKKLDELFANPPATITVTNKYYPSESQTYELPEGFDPNGYGYTGYASAFKREANQCKRNIKEMEAEMVYLQDRFDKWVKVA